VNGCADRLRTYISRILYRIEVGSWKLMSLRRFLWLCRGGRLWGIVWALRHFDEFEYKLEALRLVTKTRRVTARADAESRCR
jgi:hypothetical protein